MKLLRTRGFLIFSGFAGPAVGTIRTTASRLRPLRQSTRHCIPGTTWTGLTPALAGMCAVLCRAQAAAMAPGAWARSEGLAHCWKASQRQTALRILALVPFTAWYALVAPIGTRS